MCIDIPIVKSEPIGSPFHSEFPQKGSSFSRSVHLVVILLRHERYNKDWGYVLRSESQTLRLGLNFPTAVSTKP